MTLFRIPEGVSDKENISIEDSIDIWKDTLECDNIAKAERKFGLDPTIPIYLYELKYNNSSTLKYRYVILNIFEYSGFGNYSIDISVGNKFLESKIDIREHKNWEIENLGFRHRDESEEGIEWRSKDSRLDLIIDNANWFEVVGVDTLILREILKITDYVSY